MTLTRRTLLRNSATLAGAVAARRLAALDATSAPSAAQLAADPRRPQVHLLPPANWLNDPNGPIFWRGQYHMFYQYAVDPAGNSPKLWGHAVSPDGFRWRHLPIALQPTPGGPDAGGCWTGSAVPDGDRVAFFYTGVVPAPEDQATIRDGAHSLRESVCLAFATGDLTRWNKELAAVIPAPPPGLEVTGFRDPCPWRDGDTWYLALGSGMRGLGGCVLLYRSSDLRHWTYLHPLLQGDQHSADPALAGDMWECPDFFPLPSSSRPGRHVLIHSSGGKAWWQSGVFDRTSLQFHPERSGVLDAGSFYAPKTQRDAHGNRILWGWITETRTDAQMRAAGWSGVMSLPRILTLDADGHLRITVAPRIDTLRGPTRTLRITGNPDAGLRQLADTTVQNGCGAIACSFRRDSGPFEISLVSPGRDAKTWLVCQFDPARPGEINLDGHAVPLGSGTAEAELRFFIDGSVIECFANGHGAYTRRFYSQDAVAPPVGLHIDGNAQALTALSVSQMHPISTNRLTS